MISKKETNIIPKGDMLKKDLTNRIIMFLLENQGSVTEIAKKIGSTKARVSESIRELESLNIVKKEVLGRTHNYSFNYLNPFSKEIYRMFLVKKSNDLNKKLNYLPSILTEYLKRIFKKNFEGMIFFGSCILEEEFRDIDVFLLFSGKQDLKTIEKAIKDFETFYRNHKLSYLIGTKKEIVDNYLKKEDMFYQNLMKGVPFGCLNFFLDLRFKEHEAILNDIIDRTITGLREVINSLKERDDKRYVRKHMENGLFNIIYAFLRYHGKSASNDYEAMNLVSEYLTKKEVQTLRKLKEGHINFESCRELAIKLGRKVFM